MSSLKTLTTQEGIADERDSLGGNLLPSGLYDCKVAMARIQVASSGAMGLVLELQTTDKKTVRETLWMTSGKDKGLKNYYERDGQKNYLPGFLVANSLALLTVGKEISEIETEEKVVSIWSRDAKAEVPTKAEVLVELIGQEITAGIIRQTVDRTVKNEQTNEYEPTGETRDENTIDKLFRASDRKTTAEIRAKAEKGLFAEQWEAKWAGVTRDRTAKQASAGGKPRAAGATGAAAAPNGAAGAPQAPRKGKPTASLFSSGGQAS